MSMNLYFYSTCHNINIDFPIQTPSYITDKVIKARYKAEQMSILKEWIEKQYPNNSDYKPQLLYKINTMLNDDKLELFAS